MVYGVVCETSSLSALFFDVAGAIRFKGYRYRVLLVGPTRPRPNNAGWSIGKIFLKKDRKESDLVKSGFSKVPFRK